MRSTAASTELGIGKHGFHTEERVRLEQEGMPPASSPRSSLDGFIAVDRSTSAWGTRFDCFGVKVTASAGRAILQVLAKLAHGADDRVGGNFHRIYYWKFPPTRAVDRIADPAETWPGVARDNR
jgi:hypothetical protein